MKLSSCLTLPALTLALGLAGCAKPPAPVDETARLLDTRLAASADRIDKMLVDIARAGAISASAPKAGTVEVKGDLVTVVWHGDAPDVIRKIAEAKGLSFAVMGRRVPSPVAIEAVNAPLLSVLENIGTQLGGRGDVVLKQAALEVHYRAQ